MRRLKVNLRPGEAIRVTRVTLGKEKMVYVILADRNLRYPHRKSKIAYVGTTKKGVGRIAASAAAKAEDVLTQRGVRKFYVRIVTCRPRPNVKTWVKLERALLLTFREMHGAVPQFNSQGKKIQEKDEFRYFQRERIRKIISDLSSWSPS